MREFFPMPRGVEIAPEAAATPAAATPAAAAHAAPPAARAPRLLLGAAALLALALAAVRLHAEPAALRYWPADQVRASFARGGVLTETPGYKVHTSRRVEPGQVEVHTRDTDIIHLLEGSATFVTGGTLQDGREIAPEEIRGTRLEGGTTQVLRPGDVVIVPNGTPHWFKAVEGPVLYYTVKVRAGNEVTR